MRNEIEGIKAEIEATPARSAWDRGVKQYAAELLEKYAESARYHRATGAGALPITTKTLLNGADDWRAYSWGGYALVCDQTIAERLCTPSELRRMDGGNKRPNAWEEWPDVQARALRHAAGLIIRAARTVSERAAAEATR